MEWQEIEVDGRHTVKFTDLPYVPLASPSHSSDTGDLFIGKKLGGILRHGEWGWLARYSVLQIVSLRNGHSISSYEFSESRGYESCCIKHVEDIYPNNPEIMLLAIVLESFRGPGGGSSYVAVYSVEFGKVLHNIELNLHLTCAKFMEASACRRSLLQNFDGCLAVGSEEGAIVLLDLNVHKFTSIQNEAHVDIFVPCHIVDYSLPLTEIHRNFRQCQQDGIHFGLQIEAIESPSAIQCILPIDLILGLAIGLEDGRLVLYDLTELQIFYVALPNPEVAMSSLVKMDFLEPSDDPRPCLFIWTLHENGENLHAVLHSLMYEKRLVDEEDSLTHFETFQACSVRLQLPLEATESTALACQAVSSVSTNGEDDANCLCAISWLSNLEGKNKLIIFDLNQWYKEEMPFLIEYGKQPNYLAGYVLSGECCGLQTLLNPNNIAHFNSMQRFEEHFYPNSLSFESLLLHTDGCRRYNWEGAQNRVINLLRSSNAAIFLEPNFYFNEIMRTRLMPQFMELNHNSTFSRNAKCEILLSAALEHNCVSLLRDCAKSWIDGSFMGNFSAATGLSLSTLTDWIWKRATCIKSRCNDLCKSLFEFGGYPLDSREQKELGFITRQLKLLAELLKEILVYAKKQIPERVFSDLSNKQNSLSMASNYQDILLWLLNIGLLPEASPHNDKINANGDLIPYPYEDLKEFYKTKRSFYTKLNESFISKKTGSCKLLFIDSLIEHVCRGNVLREYWLENEGNGLYPPNSLEAMLRVMLVPELNYDNKCAILLYFFLDLNMAIEEDVYKDVVANFIKFPSVFKLSAPLIKTVQAFWNLDHDHYLPAVDEFISPFNKNQNYPQWQVELLIEVLLNQNAANLALRILESQPSLISPLLKLNTLLANDLISEAFHFVRCKNDDSLLGTFFTRCLRTGQFGVIRDLALSDHEGLILQNILKNMKTPGAESLHFVYLLQKSKYIEAVSYLEEMSNRAKGLKTSLIRNSQMDTPNLVLSAFNTTMTPVTQGLTDIYFRIKNKIKKKEINNQSPVPLSCQLIKQNANTLLGGIYHSSALSAHFATYYWGEMEEQTTQTKHLLNSNNAPFLRRPQNDSNNREFLNKNNISYPQEYKVSEKRTLIESGEQEDDHDRYERQKLEHKLNPKKKRRLIGQEIVDNLANVMKMKNTMDASEFNFETQQPQSEALEPTKAESFDLLLTPLAAKPKEIEPPKVSQAEIQGILKPYPSDSSQRDPLNEEEKSLRFRLPSGDTSTIQLQQQQVKINDDIPQKTVDNVEEQTSPGDSPNFKRFSRSLSVESHRSSSSKSVEDFYSPLSSLNNSKLDSSNISKLSILSGPQPRKPLARVSVERSEKSPTPEKRVREATTPQYVTSTELNIKTKISPRRTLERCTTETVEGKKSSDPDFVTAKEIFSEPYSLASSKAKETTSNFGCLKSSQATLTVSKIEQFLPKESSSKVGATESVCHVPEPAKISECTTVLGSLTTLESISNVNTTSSISSTSKPSEEQKRHMMETTLGMSTYDSSVLESTSQEQVKSSSVETDNETTLKTEIRTNIVSVEQALHENETKEVEDSELNKESSLLVPRPEPNDVCIVLSSSSSSLNSSSSSKFQHQQEDDNSKGYNDYDKDDDDENYDIDTVDYEGEEEYEIGNDGYDNRDEYDIENEVNMEDSNDDETDALKESMEDDHNEDMPTEESDSSSIAGKEEVIQLIDDSSCDVQQKDGDYYDESDSDDVKVIEYEASRDVIEKQIDLKESILHEKQSEEEAQKEKEGFWKDKGREDSKPLETQTAKDNPEDNEKSHQKSGATETDSLALETSQKVKTQISISQETREHIETNEAKLDSNESQNILAQEKTIENSDSKTENMMGRVENNESMEEQSIPLIIEEESNDNSPAKKKPDENTEKKPETASERKENAETPEEQSVPLNIEDCNEECSSEENPIEKKPETPIEQIKTKESSQEESIPLGIEESNQNSMAEEKAAENMEEKMETDNGNESEEQPMLLRMEDSNDYSPVKEKSRENVEKETETAIQISESKDKPMENIATISYEKESNESKNDLPQDHANIEAVQSIKEAGAGTSNKELLKSPETITQQSPKDERIGDEKKVMEKTNKNVDEKSKLKPENMKEGVEIERENKFAKHSEEVLQNNRLLFNTASKLPKELDADKTPRRMTRGTSVPPQTIAALTDESVDVTPTTRRGKRAGSLQPKSKLEDFELDTPGKTPKTLEADRSEKRTTRGLSVPPGSAEVKGTRRRSVLLEAVNEDVTVIDSPSARTRLRSRLNSVESEMEQKTPHKHTRRDSINSQPETSISKGTPRTLRARSVQPVQEEGISQTPKRKRRDSVNSHAETNTSVGTPRSLRSRSVLSVQEEDADNISATAKATSRKNNESKRQKISDEPLPEHKELQDKISPKSDTSPISEIAYSSSRRLTRTQLAIMEKSAFLMKSSSAHAPESETVLSTQNKRPKSRAKRTATEYADSDDTESISSKLSTVSSVTGIKRRVTRSSLKAKDEVEDDRLSVASSLGSDKQLRARRSKDKGSPSATLTTIPEEAPTVELKKRGRTSKH